ncbi:hypothetical protein EV385_0653 [Krasilnikovia cinnamomea]|uniref:Uncharacterized protein n=1 Tax=Krasilnikovia cinnamomea TaxID=349313 RepID=A0A4Q7ZFY7_9ACTN|nr:nuclear transport factor 2 family protein [Krasilnikovia cinnamomea]RZU48919.1 hypothetical protein EV385_0653 [Krasilnikovia cinnamomea]
MAGTEAGERIVAEALAAATAGDVPALTALLHPYLHWAEPGVRLRGRRNVLARLAVGPAPQPPTAFELRDGQIYRWTRT